MFPEIIEINDLYDLTCSGCGKELLSEEIDESLDYDDILYCEVCLEAYKD